MKTKSKSKSIFTTITPTDTQPDLRPYQQRGIKKLSKLKRSFLFDVPGLGKTPQLIGCINVWKPQHVVLVAPSSVRHNLLYELQRFLTHSRTAAVILDGSADTIRQLLSPDSQVDTIIISYALAASPKYLPLLTRFLGKSNNSLFACDEAHHLRNFTTKRTREILRHYAKNCTRSMYITGTPLYKKVWDLYPLLVATDILRNTTLHQFKMTYSWPIQVSYGSGVDFKGKRNIQHLKKLIAPYTVRRKKEQVQKDLPERGVYNVYIDGTTELPDYATIKRLQSELRSEDPDPKILKDASISKLRRELAVAKLEHGLPWLLDYIDSLPEDEPLVVFAHHKEIIDALHTTIRNHLEEKSVVTLTGSTTPTKRAQYVKEFQAGKHKVIIVSMLAGGEGITLTAASKCVFFELDWTAVVMSQCIDRIHRFGQEKKVSASLIIIKDSLDDLLINLIGSKIKLANQVLD